MTSSASSARGSTSTARATPAPRTSSPWPNGSAANRSTSSSRSGSTTTSYRRWADRRGQSVRVSAPGVGSVVAAIVFTDIVGSTARDRRSGPARAEQLRRALLSATNDIVSTRDGRLVKSTGDGFLSVYGSPSMAVDAAVALQQAATEAGRGQPDPVVLRVGIAVGEVTVDEGGDCFGLPVVEAARLCDGAQGGQILVSELVRQMARSSTHPFRSL